MKERHLYYLMSILTAASFSSTVNANPTSLHIFSGHQEAIFELPDNVEKASPAKTLFEGDIVLTKSQAEVLRDVSKKNVDYYWRSRRRRKRKVIRNLTGLWPDHVINYDFHESVGSDKRQFIEAAINHWMTNTCLKFIRGRSGDYLLFVKGSGCFSNVGRVGGRQEVSVGAGCEKLGVVSHELGHVLGLWHEQSRPERDDYVKIHFQNVMKDARGNFHKLTNQHLNDYGVVYDVGSIMHYGSRAFANDLAFPTIETIDLNFMHTLGQRNKLSFTDAKQINAVYCRGICKNTLPCKHGGYPDPSEFGSHCNRCKCPDGIGGPTCETVEKSSSENCGGTFEATTQWQEIQANGSGQECHWDIRAPRDRNIQIEIIRLIVKCRLSCEDYIEVKYKENFEQTGSRFCCDLPKKSLTTSESRAIVSFVTNSRAYAKSNVKFRYRVNPVNFDSQKNDLETLPNKVFFETPDRNTVNNKYDVHWNEWQPWTQCTCARIQEESCGLKICSRLIFDRVSQFCCPGYTRAINEEDCVINN